jgi:hypothetical protein
MQQPQDKQGNDIGVEDILVSDHGHRFKVLSIDHLQGSLSAMVKCLDSVEPGYEQRGISRYDLCRYYTIETKAVHEYLPSDPKLVEETVRNLLTQLPKSYPPYIFSRNERGYWLEIERTIIFRGASSADAIKHTKNYVEAREGHPDLPIGVIYGIYD